MTTVIETSDTVNRRSSAPSHLATVSRQLATVICQKDKLLFRNLFGSTENVLEKLDVKRGFCGDASILNDEGRCCFGIDYASVPFRRSQCGRNIISYTQHQSLKCFLYYSVGSNKLVRILFVAAVLCLVVDLIGEEETRVYGWRWSIMIFLSLFILVFQVSHEYFREDIFFPVMDAGSESRSVSVWRYSTIEHGARLPPLPSVPTSTRVTQEFQEYRIPAASLVVGDVFRIAPGDQLSCDALLLSSNAPILVDENLISGECEEQQKEVEGDVFLVSGSLIHAGSGEGVAVACAVGMDSSSGQGLVSLRGAQQHERTPLRRQMQSLTNWCLSWSSLFAIFTLLLLTLKDVYLFFAFGYSFSFAHFFSNCITALTLVVLAVPEGLPLAMAWTLSHTMQQMARRNSVVRSFVACEAIGSTTVLCIDKTGTLTKPSDHISLIVVGLTTFQTITNDNMSAPETVLRTAPNDFLAEEIDGGYCGRAITAPHALDCGSILIALSWPIDAVKLFFDALAWSSFNPALGAPMNANACAVLNMSSKLVFPPRATAVGSDIVLYDLKAAISTICATCSSLYKRFPPNSHEKLGVTVVMDSHKRCVLLYLYGSAEMVLAKCDAYLSRTGHTEIFTPETLDAHQKVIEEHSAKGLRLWSFAVASEPFPNVPVDTLPAEWTRERCFSLRYCLVGMVGREELLQDEVINSLRHCRAAGIRVVMVTGDAQFTACNVALRCGVLKTTTEPYAMLTGPAFRQLDDAQLSRMYLPHLRLLSRATPLDKKRLIQLLQQGDPSGVVAMVGDGMNDVLALKMSDVGFAMSSGSTVAKSVADIILLDNFSGTVSAIRWGRTARDNLRRFLQYQLTVNLGGSLEAFFGALLEKKNISPLRPVQLLWLNLMMNGFAAFALAAEPPCDDVLQRLPEREDSRIVTRSMRIGVVVQTFFQLLVQFALLLLAPHFLRHNDSSLEGKYASTSNARNDVLSSFIFNVFVWMQIFNFFNARLLSVRTSLFSGIWDSKRLVYIVGSIGVVQILIIHFGEPILMTVPLTFSEWFFSLLIGFTAFPIGFFSRWVPLTLKRRKVL